MSINTCKIGLWDSTVPGIQFDKDGVSNYAIMYNELEQTYPRGDVGRQEWDRVVSKIKSEGSKKKYDCIVGVSGGTDSCYLLYLAHQCGLRPLAVNLDNGWNSDIAVKNIKKVTSALSIDLETYVIDYEEVKVVLRAYLKSGLPWVDGPTDIAIKAALYKIAAREGIRYILNGSDFRSEGKQPSEWTYTDSKQLLYILNQFENIKKLKTYPYYSFFQLFKYGFLYRTKMFRPFYFVDYKKSTAQEFLKKTFGWEYYGGHHHENIFTKFAISYWMPKRFGIDKRKITLSAQVMSGDITREEALIMLRQPAYDPILMERDKDYVIKKLGITSEEFNNLMTQPLRYYYDYPSFISIFKFTRFLKPIIKRTLPFIPSILFEQGTRNSKK